PCATMSVYCATACSMYVTVCGEKIGRFEATLSLSLARASNVSSQLPRRSDCRISEIRSCAPAGAEIAAMAKAPAPERKKRRLVFIVIPDLFRLAGLRASCPDSKVACVNNVPTITIETGGEPERSLHAPRPRRSASRIAARSRLGIFIGLWRQHGFCHTRQCEPGEKKAAAA